MQRPMKKNMPVPARLLGCVVMLPVCLAAIHGGPGASPPVIDGFERDGDAIRFHFTGQPLYDYTVEFTDSLTNPTWQPLASYRAKVQPIEVAVTNSFTNAQRRFFRVRQEPCGCR